MTKLYAIDPHTGKLSPYEPSTPKPRRGAPVTLTSLAAEIKALPGRNDLEKANSYLTANEPGHGELNYAEQIWRSKMLLGDLAGLVTSIRMSAEADPSAKLMPNNEFRQRLSSDPKLNAKCAELTAELRRATADGDTESVVKIIKALNRLIDGESEEDNDLEEEDISVTPEEAKQLIKNCSGTNQIHKAQVYLSARHPSFNRLDYATQVWRASQFVRHGEYSVAK